MYKTRYVSILLEAFLFFSSRRRHTRYWRDWSSDVCSSDLQPCIMYVIDKKLLACLVSLRLCHSIIDAQLLLLTACCIMSYSPVKSAYLPEVMTFSSSVAPSLYLPWNT